jgi:hypothetical protein
MKMQLSFSYLISHQGPEECWKSFLELHKWINLTTDYIFTNHLVIFIMLIHDDYHEVYKILISF